MKKNPHEGHRERVRERFLKEGGEHFQDHELLEMLLFACIPMKNTNEKAHLLLEEFGSLSMLIEADPMDIVNRCQVSLNVAIFLSGLNELIKRSLRDKWKGRPILKTAEESGKYAMSLFAQIQFERFYVICLDASCRFIHAVMIAEGTPGEVRIFPRDVVAAALRHNASAIILTHNHPGGNMVPSVSDLETTHIISSILKLINILVVDHIIVGHNEYLSFATRGFLKKEMPKEEKGISKK